MIKMKKDAKFGIAILILLLVLIIITGSYAFFEAVVNKDNDNSATVTTKKLSIHFQDGPEIVLDNVLPGQKIIKTFSVSNTGNTTQTYHLEFIDVVNELSRESDLVYTLTSTNGGATKSETEFATDSESFATNIEIPANTTQEYTMVIEYKNLSEDQSIDMNSHISAKIQVNQIIRVSTSGTSIIDILNKKRGLGSGYYEFVVEGDNETVTYPVHLIVLEGDQVITEDTRYGDVTTDCATGTDTSEMAKNMVIVKVNGDYTINSNITVGPVYDPQYGGPKGFMLYVTGKLTNNGTIDQTHGAYATGDNVYLWKNEDGSFEFIPAVGGGGAQSITLSNNSSAGANGTPGATVSKRALGGGGSGGVYGSSPTSGAGGPATSYSGGTGGGSGYGNGTGTDGDEYGGIGGVGGGMYPQQGAGNPGGTNGTGGLLIIYADGFANGGSINVNGSNGVKGTNSDQVGSGGSGAGSINIITNQATNAVASTNVNTLYGTMLGSTSTDGGTCTGKKKGGTGGAGTVNIGEIRNGQYYDLKAIIQQDIDALN